jgi:hypothetical protein
MTQAWRDRRTDQPNRVYEGPDRRWLDDGAISPAERFQRNEKDIGDIKGGLDRVETKLDRLAGVGVAMIFAIPFILWLLNRLFPAAMPG